MTFETDSKAFAERGHKPRGAIGRPVSDKPDHRHRRLLRARGERPRDCRTAEKRDELAPSDVALAGASGALLRNGRA
jgi:hypothetical protein